MATLTANEVRSFQLGELEDYPVIADDIIFEGAAVGENASGYSRPLVAGDAFQGFCTEKADNTGGAAGDINVNVKTRGRVQLSVTGATAVTANDRPPVYAADDNDFTLTSTSNSLIGYVSRWVSSGVCIVEFDALAVKAALQA